MGLCLCDLLLGAGLGRNGLEVGGASDEDESSISGSTTYLRLPLINLM